MVQQCRWGKLAFFGVLTFMWGCAPQGKVGQGRVIAFDAAAGTLTVIEDSSAAPGNPRYDVLPPRVLEIPADPRSMGPPPVAGKLLQADFTKGELVVFDARTQSLKTVRYDVVRQQEGVHRTDPQLAGKQFPIIDREARTVTLYSSQRRILVTLSVPEQYLSLPDDTWTAGDEVRYYYKVEGRALRVMNVSQTDIS